VVNSLPSSSPSTSLVLSWLTGWNSTLLSLIFVSFRADRSTAAAPSTGTEHPALFGGSPSHSRSYRFSSSSASSGSSRNLHVGLPRSGVRKKRAISWVDFVVRLVQTWVRPRLSFRTSATSPSSRGRLPRTTLISTCFSVSVPASSTPDVACNWWSGFKSCRSGLESPASQSTSHRFTPSPVSLPPSVNGYRVSMTSSIWYSSSLLRCRV